MCNRKAQAATTCYMCNNPKTSDEHVPPKCLFPEAKDVANGKDYRVNLITVPSCDEHNSEKSKDDVYLSYVLAINILSNNTSKKQFSSKIIRAIKRVPHVYREFSKNNMQVALCDENGNLSKTAAIEIDRTRFDKSLKHIAYGIYYEKYNKKFKGDVTIFTDGLIDIQGSQSVEFNEAVQQLGVRIDLLFKDIPREGKNQEIFSYQCVNSSDPVCTFIRFTFYGGFNVTAIMADAIRITGRSLSPEILRQIDEG
jgi:hypothetical protein